MKNRNKKNAMWKKVGMNWFDKVAFRLTIKQFDEYKKWRLVASPKAEKRIEMEKNPYLEQGQY